MTQINFVSRNQQKCSADASGWAEWALAHPEIWSSVNPITTRGADFAHHITASPNGFENPAASLKCKGKTLLVIEIFFALHRDCTVTAEYNCYF